MTLKSPTVYGVGYLDDEKTVGNNGKHLLSYKCWQSMLERCYSNKFQEKCPTYIGCSVCESWKHYSIFKEWFDKNYYEIEGENIQLDKDILIDGNKLYSPDTCVFVPKKINIVFRSMSKKSNLPMGVYYDKEKKKYRAQINIDGKTKKLGRFNTPEEASQCYQIARSKYILELAEEYKDKIPNKLYKRLIKIATKIN